jgi:hypothetical protein
VTSLLHVLQWFPSALGLECHGSPCPDPPHGTFPLAVPIPPPGCHSSFPSIWDVFLSAAPNTSLCLFKPQASERGLPTHSTRPGLSWKCSQHDIICFCHFQHAQQNRDLSVTQWKYKYKLPKPPVVHQTWLALESLLNMWVLPTGNASTGRWRVAGESYKAGFPHSYLRVLFWHSALILKKRKEKRKTPSSYWCPAICADTLTPSCSTEPSPDGLGQQLSHPLCMPTKATGLLIWGLTNLKSVWAHNASICR